MPTLPSIPRTAQAPAYEGAGPAPAVPNPAAEPLPLAAPNPAPAWGDMPPEIGVRVAGLLDQAGKKGLRATGRADKNTVDETVRTITPRDVAEFAAMYNRFPNIKKVTLTMSVATDAQVSALADVLATHSQAQAPELNLCFTPLHPLSGPVVSKLHQSLSQTRLIKIDVWSPAGAARPQWKALADAFGVPVCAEFGGRRFTISNVPPAAEPNV